METGYWVGGIACAAYGLLCVWIGAFKPQALLRLVKQKLKMFAGSKEPSDKAAAITCIVFGIVALIAAVILFVVGAANA